MFFHRKPVLSIPVSDIGPRFPNSDDPRNLPRLYNLYDDSLRYRIYIYGF